MNINKNPEWMKSARCREVDTEIFYPDKSDAATGTHARKVCISCEVKVECLEYALSNNELFGIWGGLNPKSRQRIRRKKAA
jgi:WhiB family redox-sensing transcriptional regulator